MWPVYSHKELIHDKCIISEITCHTFDECDHMFFPEFIELAKYATMRFNAINYIPGSNGQELADL